MNYDNFLPGGDEEILEDRDLNQILNEEDQSKVVNNEIEPEASKPEDDNKKSDTNVPSKEDKPSI
ncbi:MAG: hypothetical protein H7Y03_15170 [Chitinophagaceae bacterium]|nr:hypothetical protein [Chitinophagaceae bacterium]